MVGTNDSVVSAQELTQLIEQERCILELASLSGMPYDNIAQTIYFITCSSLYADWKSVYAGWKDCLLRGVEFEPYHSFISLPPDNEN